MVPRKPIRRCIQNDLQEWFDNFLTAFLSDVIVFRVLRPACASFRDSVAGGEFYDNGFDALNEFLSPEAGRIAMQEIRNSSG